MRKKLELMLLLRVPHPRPKKKMCSDPVYLRGPLTVLDCECRKVAGIKTARNGQPVSTGSGSIPSMAPKTTASDKKEENLPLILLSHPQPHGLT